MLYVLFYFVFHGVVAQESATPTPTPTPTPNSSKGLSSTVFLAGAIPAALVIILAIIWGINRNRIKTWWSYNRLKPSHQIPSAAPDTAEVGSNNVRVVGSNDSSGNATTGGGGAVRRGMSTREEQAAETGRRRTRRARRNPSTKTLPLYREDVPDEEMVLIESRQEPLQSDHIRGISSSSMNSFGPSSNFGDSINDHGTEESGMALLNDNRSRMSEEGDSFLRSAVSLDLQSDDEREVVAVGRSPPATANIPISIFTEQMDIANQTAPLSSEVPTDNPPAYIPPSRRRPSGPRRVGSNISMVNDMDLSPLSPSVTQLSTTSSRQGPTISTENLTPATRVRPKSGFLSGLLGRHSQLVDSPSTPLSSRSHKFKSPSQSSFLSRQSHASPSRRDMNASTSSLGPISSPIPETLTRTNWNYPKAKPTPDQLKFLTSEDNLNKYGINPSQLQAPPSFDAAASSESLISPPSINDLNPVATSEDVDPSPSRERSNTIPNMEQNPQGTATNANEILETTTNAVYDSNSEGQALTRSATIPEMILDNSALTSLSSNSGSDASSSPTSDLLPPPETPRTTNPASSPPSVVVPASHTTNDHTAAPSPASTIIPNTILTSAEGQGS